MSANDKQRILSGAIGGAIPILLNLLRLDPETMFVGVTLAPLIGYGAQGLLLALIGGTVAYFMKDEENPWKTFTIGMTAPAMLTGLLNTKEIKQYKPKPAISQESESPRGSTNPIFAEGVRVATLALRITDHSGLIADNFAIPVAAAVGSAASEATGIKVLEVLPTQGAFDEFLRGLVGAESQPVYLLAAGDSGDKSKAQTIRNQLKLQLAEARNNNYFVDVVHKPFLGARDRYYVLVGAHSRKTQAPRFIKDELKPLAFRDKAEALANGNIVNNIFGSAKEVPFVSYVQ